MRQEPITIDQFRSELSAIESHQHSISQAAFIAQKCEIYARFADAPSLGKMTGDAEIASYLEQLSNQTDTLKQLCEAIIHAAGRTSPPADEAQLSELREEMRDADKECLAFIDNIALIVEHRRVSLKNSIPLQIQGGSRVSLWQHSWRGALAAALAMAQRIEHDLCTSVQCDNRKHHAWKRYVGVRLQALVRFMRDEPAVFRYVWQPTVKRQEGIAA